MGSQKEENKEVNKANKVIKWIERRAINWIIRWKIRWIITRRIRGQKDR